MTKELSPLEALYELNRYVIEGEYTYFRQHYQIIETALKDSEWYKQEMIKFEKAFTEENEEKLKLKEVLEIIKKKNVNCELIRQSRTFDIYNISLDSHNFGIVGARHNVVNAEEFDLLKEELK